ncbi:hypothetical protein [Gracilimonas mengyeensis]|uniref:Hydroxyneurosporene synthase (CrtC) n=1 Tax=Gracilimonas mengyeensis TaxID=1302730 RepID=A0A521AX27_9BACT|nr:hypothetical protein [Gracilimonas mengyeensis]SMO39100.1 hypothetical protein SAMN06265219_101397 [Gracilimonas mengyeensis]
MNISTDFAHLKPDANKTHDGYEWWYVDGLSKDGQYGFVIIFYHENPFSTQKIKKLETDERELTGSEHPAVSVSVYKNSETIYYSFLEYSARDFDWQEQSLCLKLGKDELRYKLEENEVELELILNQKLASGHSINGAISAKAVRPSSELIKSKSSDLHRWNLLLPSLDFEASFLVDGKEGREELAFGGKGYHDHNTGNEPMKESFRDWYWGRYHFEGLTLVYYLMQKHDGEQFEAWLIDEKNQSVLQRFDEVKLEYFTLNTFGLRSARKIELNSGEVSVNIQSKDKIDDGPFYQRFLGNGVLRYNGQVYGAHGISEYIYPKNIYNKLFWPLVHMRLRQVHQKPHWVQKSALMYPWTW